MHVGYLVGRPFDFLEEGGGRFLWNPIILFNLLYFFLVRYISFSPPPPVKKPNGRQGRRSEGGAQGRNVDVRAIFRFRKLFPEP